VWTKLKVKWKRLLDYDKEKLQERLAKLMVVLLYLRWCCSEVEWKRKKDRVDDALHASCCSWRRNCCRRWCCLLRAKNVLSSKADNADEATGIQIVSRAVESPLRTIVENAGLEGSVVVAKLLKVQVIWIQCQNRRVCWHACSR
jgi:chaperonin GroEL